MWSIGTTLSSEFKDKKNDGSSATQDLFAGGSDNVRDEADTQATEARNNSMGHVGALKNVQGGKTGERIEARTNDATVTSIRARRQRRTIRRRLAQPRW